MTRYSELSLKVSGVVDYSITENFHVQYFTFLIFIGANF